jgi:thiol-disulfide isomerase/thioredoxin
MRFRLLLRILLIGGLTAAANAGGLGASGAGVAGSASTAPLPGDRVPDLGELVEWSHGAPVPSFESERVYVLDFWATWCPPCYPMIDELSALAQHHREDGLVIVGLTIGADLGTPLHRFLERESQRIEYTIATARDDDELKAALLHPLLNPPDDFYLPHLMIIDRSGRLAWVSEAGDPKRGFEDALSRVLSGTWNLQAEAARARQMVESAAEGEEQLEEIRELRVAGDLDRAATALTRLVSETPSFYSDEAVDLFHQMLCAGRETSAYAFGRELLGGGLEARVPELLRLHRAIILTPGLETRDLERASTAVRAARRARADEDPDLLYELAKISLLAGDSGEASAFQAEAVRIAQRTGRDAHYIRTIRDLPIQRIIESQAQQMACPQQWITAASDPKTSS